LDPDGDCAVPGASAESGRRFCDCHQNIAANTASSASHSQSLRQFIDRHHTFLPTPKKRVTIPGNFRYFARAKAQR
jgi:hypothetical protein